MATSVHTIWKTTSSPDLLNALCAGTCIEHLGILFTRIGQDFIEATMPVDKRTIQPMQLLHGGASATLAESLAGAASYLASTEGTRILGTHLTAHHFKKVSSENTDRVTGICSAIHLGKRQHTWKIKLFDATNGELCSMIVVTNAILDND